MMPAFVIALTFGSTANRFDTHKTALLDDVNGMQTAYLRANPLPEPHRTPVRSLMRDHVEVRVGMLFASALNDTISSHATRVGLGAHDRISGFV